MANRRTAKEVTHAELVEMVVRLGRGLCDEIEVRKKLASEVEAIKRQLAPKPVNLFKRGPGRPRKTV